MVAYEAIGRGFLAAWVITMVAAAADAQTKAGEGPKDSLLAGGKFLHKLPYETPLPPIFLETTDGPRLAVWVLKENPVGGGAPKVKEDKKKNVGPPDMQRFSLELSVWDVKAGKELYRMGKEESAPPPPVHASVWLVQRGMPFGMLHCTPDGKKLASTLGFNGVKTYDPETRQWQTAFKNQATGIFLPTVVFAADGTMIILNLAQCTVQEIGKAEPRQTFKLDRAGGAMNPTNPTNPNFFGNTEFDDAILTPDGKTLAVAVDNMVNVYDIKTGKRIFEAPRLSPAKTAITAPVRASLAFAPSGEEPKLLAVETISNIKKDKWLTVARVLDIKTKKESARATLSEVKKAPNQIPGMLFTISTNWGVAYPYFNAKGEPRVLLGLKLFDVATGKVVQKTDVPEKYIASRDGRYVVRLTGTTRGDERKMGVEVWSVDMDR
jgi:hypothetical protein